MAVLQFAAFSNSCPSENLKSFFFFLFSGTNVLFERTVCEMNATEKNLVIIIYIYVNFYMKKSVGREEDLSWFDLQERLPRLFQLLVQILLLSHFFNNWSCLDIEYKSQFKQTIWEEERIMQQIFLRVLCRLKSVLELLSVAFIITQPMVDLAFVFCFHANIY